MTQVVAVTIIAIKPQGRIQCGLEETVYMAWLVPVANRDKPGEICVDSASAIK